MNGPRLVCVACEKQEVTMLSPLCKACGETLLVHSASADCWCEPEVNYVDPDSGATVYVHRGIQ